MNLNIRSFFYNNFCVFLIGITFNLVFFFVRMIVDLALSQYIFVTRNNGNVVEICCLCVGMLYITGLVLVGYVAKKLLKDVGCTLHTITSIFLPYILESILFCWIVFTENSMILFVSPPFDVLLYILKVGFNLRISTNDIWYYFSGLIPFLVMSISTKIKKVKNNLNERIDV